MRKFAGMLRRHAVVAVGLIAGLMVFGPSAFAAEDTQVTGALTSVAGNLKDTLVPIAVIALGVALVLFAIRAGWRLITRFAK